MLPQTDVACREICSNLERHEEPANARSEHQHPERGKVGPVRRTARGLEEHVEPDHPQPGPHQHLR